MTRTATVRRETGETKINLTLEVDGVGLGQIRTGIGFFDHMLVLLAKHGLFDLTIEADGDLHVDAHHVVEDVGICLGMAFKQALGDKEGICRFGSATVPMDETLVTAAVDLSGRAYCVWIADLPQVHVGAVRGGAGGRVQEGRKRQRRHESAHSAPSRQQRAPSN